jgi:hypothetical protein
LRRTGPPGEPSRSNNSPLSLAGQREPVGSRGQHCHASSRPQASRERENLGRAPFPRVPTERSTALLQRIGSHPTRRRRNACPGRASRRSGRSASQPRRPRAQRLSSPRPFWQPADWYACTSCIGTSSPSPTAPWPLEAEGRCLRHRLFLVGGKL